MKNFLVLSALLLASCSKGPIEVEYAVSCQHCSVRWLDENGISKYTKLVPDTTFTDTSTIVDPGPYFWSTRITIDRDAEKYFDISRLQGNGVETIATRTVDGSEETRVINLPGEHIFFD